MTQERQEGLEVVGWWEVVVGARGVATGVHGQKNSVPNVGSGVGLQYHNNQPHVATKHSR